MKTIGIICEYNPFHNGHAHQLHTLATKYPDVLRICIMSGPLYNVANQPLSQNSIALVGLFSAVQISLSNFLRFIR